MEKVVPILNCKDLSESINFYRDRLGFDARVESWDQAGRPSVAAFARAGVEFRASQDRGDPGSERARELRLKEPGVAVDLYINVDDVDAEYRLLTNRGVRTQSPPEDRFWGERTFTAFDPDGYRLTFAQRIVETAAEESPETEDEFAPVPGPAVRLRPASPPATTPARTPKEPAGPKPAPPRKPVRPGAKQPGARKVAAGKKPTARKAAAKKPARPKVAAKKPTRAKVVAKKLAPAKAAKKAKQGRAGPKVAPSRPSAKPGRSAAARRGPRSTPRSRASQGSRKRAGATARAKQAVKSVRRVTSPSTGRKKGSRARRG